MAALICLAAAVCKSASAVLSFTRQTCSMLELITRITTNYPLTYGPDWQRISGSYSGRCSR